MLLFKHSAPQFAREQKKSSLDEVIILLGWRFFLQVDEEGGLNVCTLEKAVLPAADTSCIGPLWLRESFAGQGQGPRSPALSFPKQQPKAFPAIAVYMQRQSTKLCHL